MFWTNIKLIFRNLWKDRITSSINIFGFAFSISICVIIAIYVLHEFSYDKFHKNYDNIYRVTNAETQEAHVDNTIEEDVLETLPEVKNHCHWLQFDQDQTAPIQYEQEVIDINYVASADNNFFKIFSFPILMGNQDAPFDKNNKSLLISESIAHKLFGNKNPIGKTVTVFNEIEYIVCGVFKDFPKQSSICADIIRNEAYEVSKNNMVHCSHNKCEYKRNIFITLNDRASIDGTTEKINTQLASMDKFLKKVNLQPFKKIYLHDETHNNYLKKGNLQLLKLLSSIALITLLLASINYINLTIAQYKKRIKEVGIRKTIGAPRVELIRSFLRESMVVTFISILVAITITAVFLPIFSSFFNLQVDLQKLIEPNYLSLILLAFFILGLINGLFPAFIITSFKPINLIQKRFVKVEGHSSLKNILTTFQFAVSITLIFSVIIIFKQLSFIKHKDLGFEDSYLLKINSNHANKYDVLREELTKNPSILNLTYSSGIPGVINWGSSAGDDSNGYQNFVSVIGADDSFIPTFNIELLEGRELLKGDRDKCLINETALKMFGWKTWEGKYFNKSERFDGLEIIGLVKDFHFGSLHEKIEPIIISSNDSQKSFLSLRISGNNIQETMNFIEKTWKKVEPNVPLNYTFYDAWFDSMYKKEEQLGKMVSTFAILAIIISCLGIFGQAIISTTNRIKEIGVRKVNGAKSKEIVGLINSQFILWVLLSMLCSIPLGSSIMNKWLENFAYKTNMSWWVFALAGAIALIIALVTVSWQSWRAASRNPVEALRYE